MSQYKNCYKSWSIFKFSTNIRELQYSVTVMFSKNTANKTDPPLRTASQLVDSITRDAY
jgi:hypothetical protein